MRKGMAQGIARPTYYDRNPVAKAFTYDAAAVAPHAQTTRWTYTVPAGKKAQLQTSTFMLERDAAAAPAGYTRSQIVYTPSGGGNFAIYVVEFVNAGVDANRSSNIGLGMTLLAGDQLISQTQDGSTGGSVAYVVGSTLQEFDA